MPHAAVAPLIDRPLLEALPPDRAAALRRIDRLAAFLDGRFRAPVFGVAFGYDSLIGLVPGVGDAATACISLYLVNEARRAGADGPLLRRMLANVAIDAAVGSVPLLGDVFDVYFKANRRNVALLRAHIAKKDAADVPR